MKNIIKILFFIICITSISKFAFSKSPPPGTGTADVPANILIMLDNSGSMAYFLDLMEVCMCCPSFYSSFDSLS